LGRRRTRTGCITSLSSDGSREDVAHYEEIRRPDVVNNLSLLTDVNAPVTQTRGTSTNASSMIVGDFSKLIVAIRSPMRIEVLREPTTAVNLEYGFLAWLRIDVAATNSKAFAKVTGIIPA
jgi:hypothetical protein